MNRINTIVLSIKPHHANKIFDGNEQFFATKTFEFRRAIFKNKDIKYVLVYSSAPTKMIIGYFQIDHVLHEELDNLWKLTQHSAGIERAYFDAYFKGKDKGYAIKAKHPVKLEVPIHLFDFLGMKPPQSFAYVKDRDFQQIKTSIALIHSKKK